MEKSQAFQAAFNNMPTRFSGNEYCKFLRKYGISDKQIAGHIHLEFLHENCTQNDDSNRYWIKKQTKPVQMEIKHEAGLVFDSIDEMIQHLKQKGYKVLKPNIGWEEV